MEPAAFRAQFPVLQRMAYLNAGSDGPLPAAATEAAAQVLDDAVSLGRTRRHFEGRQAMGAELREIYAGRLGCPVEDVALTTSTSEGLGKVLIGLGLEPGDEVLTADDEHPGLIGPLLAAKARGVRLRSGPLATLADHVTPETTVVACSHVGWRSGLVADPRLGSAGVPLVLDGAQGIGAVPVDVRALGCAAYAGAGQKWLCGADGTGMLYIAPEWRERIRASAPAYLSFTDPAAGLESGIVADARAHDTPTLALELLATSVAAARVLEGFGWDAVMARARDGAAALAERLAAAGKEVAPRGPTTLVAWRDADPPATAARVAEQGVGIRYLPGTDLLRASVGAWNDDSDLDRLLEAL